MDSWAQRQSVVKARVMVVRCGADCENNVAELVTSFGAQTAEPLMFLACSCDGERIEREENWHGFGVNQAVRKEEIFAIQGPLIFNQFDGLVGGDEKTAIDLIADLCRKVDKAKQS